MKPVFETGSHLCFDSNPVQNGDLMPFSDYLRRVGVTGGNKVKVASFARMMCLQFLFNSYSPLVTRGEDIIFNYRYNGAWDGEENQCLGAQTEINQREVGGEGRASELVRDHCARVDSPVTGLLGDAAAMQLEAQCCSRSIGLTAQGQQG
ncbi:hypothetical protein EVAR_67818_1 [Eumeta japonica]|uniref:Uncharacterized protein n=1 Tax=Eumeta variegata TaxID=151549 RepID=A0A4C1ZUL4_EUMVA|nr:hypothetical protein EVAR_67818_1 [Eumeta japonica]